MHRNGTVKRKVHFLSVRLAVAGFASLVLLVWVTVIPGTSPIDQYPEMFPIKILCTTLLAVFIVTILGPVFWYGLWKDRLLAALATVFPALVLVATMLRLTTRVLF